MILAQNLLKIFLNCKFNVNLVPSDGVKHFSTHHGAFFGIEKIDFYTPQITVTSVNLFSPDAGNECSKN